MITTVTRKNMVVIPVDVARRLGIQPGSQLDWQPVEGKDEIVVRVIPRRGERARRLLVLLCQTKILASEHVGKYNVMC